MKLNEITTRREAREHLDAIGVEGQAAEALLQASGYSRHLGRTAQARQAAMDAAAQFMEEGDDEEVHAAMAWAIVAADQAGIGGPAMLPDGAGTARIPALTCCGTGRKQARDGGAWDAAIKAAGIEIARLLPGHAARFIVDGGDDETPRLVVRFGERVWVGSCFSQPDTEPRPVDVYLPEEGLIPGAWMFSIAAQGMQRALSELESYGKGGSGQGMPTYPRDVEVELRLWAQFYNNLSTDVTDVAEENRQAAANTVW